MVWVGVNGEESGWMRRGRDRLGWVGVDGKRSGWIGDGDDGQISMAMDLN